MTPIFGFNGALVALSTHLGVFCCSPSWSGQSRAVRDGPGCLGQSGAVRDGPGQSGTSRDSPGQSGTVHDAQDSPGQSRTVRDAQDSPGRPGPVPLVRDQRILKTSPSVYVFNRSAHSAGPSHLYNLSGVLGGDPFRAFAWNRSPPNNHIGSQEGLGRVLVTRTLSRGALLHPSVFVTCLWQ